MSRVYAVVAEKFASTVVPKVVPYAVYGWNY